MVPAVATWAVPRTLQELAAAIMRGVKHHQRNCRCAHCVRQGMQCVECDVCMTLMEKDVLENLRAVNRR